MNFKLKKVQLNDFENVKRHYNTIINKTNYMEKYARWKKDIYPTEEIIMEYINSDAMYLFVNENDIAGSLAITTGQSEDYQDMAWQIDVQYDEVAVIHILGVNPNYQQKGVGNLLIVEIMQLVKKWGMKVIRLDALATNIPAQHLYLKKGFQYIGKKNLYAENTGWTDFYFYELILIDR